MGLFIGASFMSLYDTAINYFLKIIKRLKRSFVSGIRIGKTNSISATKQHHDASNEIIPGKNQLQTKLEQLEEKLFKMEKTLNNLRTID